MLNRKVCLEKIINCPESLSDLFLELKGYPFDSEKPLVVLNNTAIKNILNRYLKGELNTVYVEEWANILEGRDDIELENSCRSQLKTIIFELANPLLYGKLTKGRAKKILADLSASGNRSPD